MSYVQIPNEIFKANLTSLQFRFLVNFIRISGLNNGHSFFGYPNLANINQCGKVAAIKTVQELEKMGFIQVVERGNRSRSNDILLTLDKGLSRLNSGENDGIEGYLKDTPNTNEGYLKDTRGYLKDTREYLKDTPHKDLKDLNNKNLNNIQAEGYLKDTPTNKKTAGNENIAPADVAAGLSKPSQQAGENSAGNVGADVWAAKDKRMRKLLTRIYPDFTTWYALFRTPAGTYQINPVSSLIERIMPDKARINSVPDGVEVCSWAETPRIGLTKIL